MKNNDQIDEHPIVDLSYQLDLPSGPVTVKLPFVIGVLAELYPSTEERGPVADRSMHFVNQSSFPAFMAFMAPAISFSVPNVISGLVNLDVSLSFTCIDDFKPEAIALQVPELSSYTLDSSENETQAPDTAQHQLRLILENQNLQQLINTWCGLALLVEQVPQCGNVQVRVMHIAYNELAKTLKKYKGTAWDMSPIFKKLCECEYMQLGGQPYNCIIGDFYLGHRPKDIEMLGEVSKIAAAAGFAFLSGASANLLQLESWMDVNPDFDPSLQFLAPEYAAFRSLCEANDSNHIFLSLSAIKTKTSHFFDTESRIENSVSPYPSHDVNVSINSAYFLAITLLRIFRRTGWFREDLSEFALNSISLTHQLEHVAPSKFSQLGLNLIGANNTGVLLPNSICPISRALQTINPKNQSTFPEPLNLPNICALNHLKHYVKSISREKYSQVISTEANLTKIRDWMESLTRKSVNDEPLINEFNLISATKYRYRYGYGEIYSLKLGYGFKCTDQTCTLNIFTPREYWQLDKLDTPVPTFMVNILADLSEVRPAEFDLTNAQFFLIDRVNFDDRLRHKSRSIASVSSPGIDEKSAKLIKLEFENLSEFEPESIANQVEQLHQWLQDRTLLISLLAFADIHSTRRHSLTKAMRLPDGIAGLASKIEVLRYDLNIEKPPTDRSALPQEVAAWIPGLISDYDAYIETQELGFLKFEEWTQQFANKDSVFNPPDLQKIIQEIDQMLRKSLEPIIHSEALQIFESFWQGLDRVVDVLDNISSGIFLGYLDLSKDEYFTNIEKFGNSSKSVPRALISDFMEWKQCQSHILFADYSLAATREDDLILKNLCEITAELGGTLIASIAPDFLGLHSWSELDSANADLLKVESIAWRNLRAQAQEHHVILCAPDRIIVKQHASATKNIREFQYHTDQWDKSILSRPAYDALAYALEKCAQIPLAPKEIVHGILRESLRDQSKMCQTWSPHIVSTLQNQGIEVVPIQPLPDKGLM